jgi:AsmA protein
VKKPLKIVGLSAAALVALLIAAVAVLLFVVDPNRYKGEIVALVKAQTGREFKIEKNIGWSFFPRLGIEAGGLELANAPGFGQEPFARIDAAGVNVALLPLFSGRIAVDTVYLHGLHLNLAKNAAGRTNWEDLMKREARPEPAEKTDGRLPIKDLTVGRLEVRRANLTWRDQTAAGAVAVRNLELTTGRFVPGEPVALQLAFELAREKAAPVKLALDSRVTATTDALSLAGLDLRLDDSRLQGGLEVRNFASPALRFDLALDKMDLDRYLGADKAAPKPAAAAPTASAAQPVELPLAALRALDLDGKLRVGELKAFGARTSEAQVQLQAKNGLVTLGPNTAKLYGGEYRGQTVLDARGTVPQLKLDEKLEQVQIGPLLKDMQLFDSYSGTGRVALALTSQGFDPAQFRRNLNGTAAIALRDGRIEGVDLAKTIEQARALYDTARGKPVAVQSAAGDSTVFKSLTANVAVANGIARNDDLVLDGQNLRATGRGSADLARETLDYTLKVTLAEDPTRRGSSVPVLVSGTFANPSYSVDFGELLKEKAQKKIEKQLEKGLEGLLQPKKPRKPSP